MWSSWFPPQSVAPLRGGPVLRWGIVAPGAIADYFAHAVRAHTDQRIVAVASRSAERAAAFASRHGIDRSYGSYEQLVHDPDVQVVYVAAPHSEHLPLGLQAISAGKHVLIEKPIALSADEYPEANNNFLSGKAAIVQMGSWYAQYAKKESMAASQEAAGVSNPTPFVMLPMMSPDFFGKGNVSGLFGETDYGISINKSAKNLEAAKTFMLWLTTNTDGQQNVANAIDLLPALKGVEADWDNLGLVNAEEQVPVFKELYAEAANPVESRNTYQSTETNNALVIAVQTALTSDDSTAEIVKQLETDAVDVAAS